MIKRMPILILVDFGDKWRNSKETCAIFNENHGERTPNTRKTVSRLYRKLLVNKNYLDVAHVKWRITIFEISLIDWKFVDDELIYQYWGTTIYASDNSEM